MNEGWAAAWFLALVGVAVASFPADFKYGMPVRIFGLCLILPVFVRLLILAVAG